jgi:hypothetical protein
MKALGNNRPQFHFEQNDAPADFRHQHRPPFAAARPTSVQIRLFRQILHGIAGLATHFC